MAVYLSCANHKISHVPEDIKPLSVDISGSQHLMLIAELVTEGRALIGTVMLY